VVNLNGIIGNLLQVDNTGWLEKAKSLVKGGRSDGHFRRHAKKLRKTSL